jgi:para-aminobenzoate synthetase component 1
LLIDGDRISFQVGGGIVADSDPEAEYQETLAKARALFETLVNADTARIPSQRAGGVR